jgi:mannose-6-phosphate isomerase
MWRISAETRAYDWGSQTAIPEFLGIEPTGGPTAELWFGTHPLGMSELSDGSSLAVVAGDLSFMLKVLAPAKPLSIQVHPSNAMAATGFATENSAGVPLTHAERDFKDPHHKPEMVYALTRFDTLLGVRPIEEIVALLAPLDLALTKELLDRATHGAMSVVEHLLSEPPTAEVVADFVAACAAQPESADVGRGYATVAEAARAHPGDPGLVLALLLTRVTLEPGEAAFVGPGLIHAHFSGLCLEVMTSSDNVFRAGLTPKRVNAVGVLESLAEVRAGSAAVHPARVGRSTEVFAPELDGVTLFALSVTDGDDSLPGDGDRILLCVDGEVEVRSSVGEALVLGRGQALFANAQDGCLSVSGGGTLAQAYVPPVG